MRGSTASSSSADGWRARLRRFATFCSRLFTHDPRRVALTFLLMLGQSALSGVGVLMLIPLLASIGITDGADGGRLADIAGFFFEDLGLPRNLLVILAVWVFLVGMRAALGYARSVVQTRLQLGFIRNARAELHAALLYADWPFLVASRRSDLVQILTNDVQRAGKAAHQLLTAIASAVTLVVFLTIALRISAWATLLATGTTGLLAWLLRDRLRAARTTGRSLTNRSNRLYALVAGHLDGLAEVRSYGAEAPSRERFDEALEELDAVQIDFIRQHSGARLWMEVGAVVTLAGLVGLIVQVLRLPAASLLLLVYIFSRVLPRATSLHSLAHQLLHSLPGFEAVDSLLNRARSRAEHGGGTSTVRLRREIEFDGVAFAYSDDRPAIRGLDLTIPARGTTAVIGPSGSGKSTAALLLMGFLRADSGRILIDGLPMEKIDLRAWRSRIGYVPQETFLLHDTIGSNLRLADPDAEDDELWRALELASADELVAGLPRGLDTVVGDRGGRLSGGERQRIALARALVSEPDLLLLDEATSSLDVDSERRIFQALSRLHGRLTIVFITHRMGSLKNVDQIVALEEGRSVPPGPGLPFHGGEGAPPKTPEPGKSSPLARKEPGDV